MAIRSPRGQRQQWEKMTDVSTVSWVILAWLVVLTIAVCLAVYSLLRRRNEPRTSEHTGTQGLRFTPIRLNLLIIAVFIALLNGGIMVLCGIAIVSFSGDSATSSTFVLGALIGLLPTGITGLVGLGTTLLNDDQK